MNRRVRTRMPWWCGRAKVVRPSPIPIFYETIDALPKLKRDPNFFDNGRKRGKIKINSPSLRPVPFCRTAECRARPGHGRQRLCLPDLERRGKISVRLLRPMFSEYWPFFFDGFVKSPSAALLFNPAPLDNNPFWGA